MNPILLNSLKTIVTVYEVQNENPNYKSCASHQYEQYGDALGARTKVYVPSN